MKKRQYGIVFLVWGFYGLGRMVISKPNSHDMGVVVGVPFLILLFSIGSYLYFKGKV